MTSLQRIGKAHYACLFRRQPDHTSCRGFAVNAGLKFRTPEEFFLGQAPAAATAFDPTSYVDIDPSDPSM